MRKTVCNLCGREFGALVNQDCNDDFSIHTRIGYGSKYDFCHLELDLCSECMDALIDRCVINPVIDPEEMYRYQEALREEAFEQDGGAE